MPPEGKSSGFPSGDIGFSWEGFSSIGKAFRWLVLEFRNFYETLQEYLPEKSLALALG